MAVHILLLNQGSTPINFVGLLHAAITLLSTEVNFKASKAFSNYQSYKKHLENLLRHRSYSRRAVAVHILLLNQGSTPINFVGLLIAAITILSPGENLEKIKEVMN